MSKSFDFTKVNFIIFDWDGTLVDSMEFYSQAFASLASEKFEADPKKAKEFFFEQAGKSLSSEIKEAAKKFAGKNIEETLELEEEFWELIEGRLSAELIPGAKESLQKLKLSGKKLIIWSGSKPEVLESQTKRLGISHFIDFCIGTQSGPNQAIKGPDFFKMIADRFKISIKDLQKSAVVVGDGAGDMEAAKKCGVFAIGVLKTTTRQNLLNAGADLIIKKISDLSNLF